MIAMTTSFLFFNFRQLNVTTQKDANTSKIHTALTTNQQVKLPKTQSRLHAPHSNSYPMTYTTKLISLSSHASTHASSSTTIGANRRQSSGGDTGTCKHRTDTQMKSVSLAIRVSAIAHLLPPLQLPSWRAAGSAHQSQPKLPCGRALAPLTY